MARTLGEELVGLGFPAPLANAMTTNAMQRVTAPSAANSAGSVGQFAVDSSYFYVCIADSTWKRAAISTW